MKKLLFVLMLIPVMMFAQTQNYWILQKNKLKPASSKWKVPFSVVDSVDYLTFSPHVIAKGDSVLGRIFMRSTDSLLLVWYGTAYRNLIATPALAPVADDILQFKNRVWTNRTLAQVKTDFSVPMILSFNCGASVTAGTTRYVAPFNITVATTDATMRYYIPYTGVIMGMYSASTSNNTGGTTIYTLVVNGTPSALVDTTATANGWSTHSKNVSVSVNAGDYISIKLDQAVRDMIMCNVSLRYYIN